MEEFNQINSEFYNLVTILKDEYEYVKNFTLTLSKDQYLPKTEAPNVIYWVDDTPLRNKNLIN